MKVGAKEALSPPKKEPVLALPEAEAGLGEPSKPQTAVVPEGADFVKIAPFGKPPNLGLPYKETGCSENKN